MTILHDYQTGFQARSQDMFQSLRHARGRLPCSNGHDAAIRGKPIAMGPGQQRPLFDSDFAAQRSEGIDGLQAGREDPHESGARSNM
jgi:hypothetical protein